MGSILLTQEGVETSTIQKDKRGKALLSFSEMLSSAYQKGDDVFMTKDALGHRYSYGDYYPSFTELDWGEFQQKSSLVGVDFKTYDRIVNAFHERFPVSIDSVDEMETKDEPRGEGGFEHDGMPDTFLCNCERWSAWHRDYLIEHPEKIVWDVQGFLPNQKAIDEILSNEIEKYIKTHYAEELKSFEDIGLLKAKLFLKAEFHEDRNIRKPLKRNANVLFFHNVVMAEIPAGKKIGYSIEVADKICKENYYQYDAKLSSKEQNAAGSKRHIYSIVKDGHKQFISIDFEKGMFEFHNHKGEHLGEYHFDGTLNAQARPDHNLNTVW